MVILTPFSLAGKITNLPSGHLLETRWCLSPSNAEFLCFHIRADCILSRFKLVQPSLPTNTRSVVESPPYPYHNGFRWWPCGFSNPSHYYYWVRQLTEFFHHRFQWGIVVKALRKSPQQGVSQTILFNCSLGFIFSMPLLPTMMLIGVKSFSCRQIQSNRFSR